MNLLNQQADNDDTPPIAVRFPLEGEWLAVQTPGHKIPSHGTNQFGQRYAYDFLTPEDLTLASDFWIGLRFWLAGGIPLKKSSSWKKPIRSPLTGKVIAAKDGWPEPRRASPIDMARILALGLGLRGGKDKLQRDFRMIGGNYLIIEGTKCFAFIAHATTGSIRVSEGDQITAGQHIANVGHTGNSSQPHLHLHLMDGPDLWTANGLPCCFESYEEKLDDKWRLVENGIPDNVTPIRSIKTSTTY